MTLQHRQIGFGLLIELKVKEFIKTEEKVGHRERNVRINQTACGRDSNHYTVNFQMCKECRAVAKIIVNC